MQSVIYLCLPNRFNIEDMCLLYCWLYAIAKRAQFHIRQFDLSSRSIDQMME